MLTNDAREQELEKSATTVSVTVICQHGSAEAPEQQLSLTVVYSVQCDSGQCPVLYLLQEHIELSGLAPGPVEPTNPARARPETRAHDSLRHCASLLFVVLHL